MSESSHDLVVIGCGMTGLSAARLALQAGRRVAGIEALTFGGLIINVNELDGAIAGSGPDVASSLMSEVLDMGFEPLTATATAIAREGRDLVVESDMGRHRAKTVIVASGARQRPLGVPGEAELEWKGVSHCADCDGPLFNDQEVAVVGGGDSALQEALVLAVHCRVVHLIHRSDSFRAKSHLEAAVRANPRIRIYWRTRVVAVLGSEAVTGVRLVGVGEVTSDLPVAGFFAYVGLQPASEFAPAEVARNAAGQLVTDGAMSTSVSGLFAAGAVRAGYRGLLTDAIAEGERAARSALTWMATAHPLAA